jgi:uncharacterized protein with LGFP repeats
LNDLTKHLISQYLPYLIAFLLGVIVAWKGCGSSIGKQEIKYVDRPVPKIEYVDRWKTDTVRFVKTVLRHDTVRDTVSQRIVDIHVDTVRLVDTLNIVESWLTEVAKYDTTIVFKSADMKISWQNYQNRSEKLNVIYTQKKTPMTFAVGIHGNAGLISDFKTSYVPLMGLGIQATVKKTYFSVDYGFNGQHYVGVRVGRNIVNL